MTLMARTTASAQQCKNRSGANTQKERKKDGQKPPRPPCTATSARVTEPPFLRGGFIVARVQVKCVGAFSSVEKSTLDYIPTALRPTAEVVE